MQCVLIGLLGSNFRLSPYRLLVGKIYASRPLMLHVPPRLDSALGSRIGPPILLPSGAAPLWSGCGCASTKLLGTSMLTGLSRCSLDIDSMSQIQNTIHNRSRSDHSVGSTVRWMSSINLTEFLLDPKPSLDWLDWQLCRSPPACGAVRLACILPFSPVHKVSQSNKAKAQASEATEIGNLFVARRLPVRAPGSIRGTAFTKECFVKRKALRQVRWWTHCGM